jgi:diguanylate cyclase (GGDEF)-like protein
MMGFRHSAWALWAAAVVAIGITGSVLSSAVVVHNDLQKARQASATAAIEIAATLRLAIEREQDLAVNTGAFVANDPNASEAQFQRWASSAQLFRRFPELVGVGSVQLVTRSALPAYAQQTERNAGQAAGTFKVSPPGSRSFYCFASLTEGPSGTETVPPDADLCQSSLGSAFLTARDSGQDTYLPYRNGGHATLAIGSAIYRGGSTPSTIAARRAAFLGWVGLQVVPGVVLATALQGHPDTGVAFRFENGVSTGTFHAGSPPPGSLATVVNLHNGWQVSVLQASPGSDIWADDTALAVLFGGTVLSLLLGMLIYVLATSRARALMIVHEQTDELRHRALHDSLTDLPNRSLILDRLDQMLLRGRRSGIPVAALFIDLDNFKDINDTLGHAAGDEILVAVANRLTGAMRLGDTVGRLGGDEFVVLAEGASLDGGAQVVADRILDALTAPFQIQGSEVPITVTASIGFAEGDRTTPGRLLQDADIALYQAKAHGKAYAIGFSPPMRAAVDGHRHLEVDLHGALEAQQFFLVFQPTVDLATGAFTGAEALLRWRHPERGVVMPDEFIPVLESSGLIIPVGAWVLEEACRRAAAWAEAGHGLVVSVNLSARQLERDRIIDDVDRALTVTGLNPDSLILELTETALMRNVEASMVRLQLLKALGVRIAVDDFGTGYSSLAYLRQFPIDVLKIDRTFVAGIAENAESAALVDTLIQLGKVLGLKTVAEGIETEEQRTLLRAAGVDVGQGYLFARPLTVADFERLLRIRGGRPVTSVP